ncbi:hypothetical protein ACLOJK_019445 [Asimina triloba]
MGGLKLCTYPPPVVPDDGQLRHLQFCQALALGCFPLVKVVHTSAKYEGQVYISEINYILMIACVAVTAGFQTTVAISNAYGLAVVFVTTLTSAFLDLMRGLLCGCEEQKQLWEILQRAPGVYGARFSGAGFGGCCTAFVDTERAVEAAPLSGMSTVKFSQIWPACSIEIFVTQESEPVLEDGKLYKSQSCCDPPMTSESGSMSGLVGAGYRTWTGIFVVSSLIGFAILLGLMGALYIRPSKFLVRNIWGYLYSNEEEVVKYVARMLPVLATSNFLDGVQCLLSGIARGCGWQKLCAFVNLGAFYGVPSLFKDWLELFRRITFCRFLYWCRHEDLDLELEEILMSDLGQPCESSSTVGCRSSGHVSNLCGLSPAFVDDRDIPSADSIKAGLAVAVAKENPGLGSVFDADRVLVSEVVNVECCSSSSIHTLSNGSGDSSHGFNDGADSSRSHLSPPTVVRPVMMAPNWTCLWRSSASLRHGSVAVLRAGEDIITVIWGLNGTTHRGVDSQYKKVKVEVCYAPFSQHIRGWRKTDNELSKD